MEGNQLNGKFKQDEMQVKLNQHPLSIEYLVGLNSSRQDSPKKIENVKSATIQANQKEKPYSFDINEPQNNDSIINICNLTDIIKFNIISIEKKFQTDNGN